MRKSILLGAVAAIAVSATSLIAQDKPAKPTFGEDGTVHGPAFELPPSELSSPEAQAFMKLRSKMPGGAPPTSRSMPKPRCPSP